MKIGDEQNPVKLFSFLNKDPPNLHISVLWGLINTNNIMHHKS